MDWNSKPFGSTTEGEKALLYSVANSNGMSMSATTYGATLVSVKVPERSGKATEVTLGFDDLSGYLGLHPYFGATVGRYANRIANARFVVKGREYAVAKNLGEHHLHGGIKGFNRYVWDARTTSSSDRASIIFSRRSPDEEENYPGNLDVEITMSLTEENDVVFEYLARTDKPTPLNLTNHSYWNLGHAPHTILDHLLYLNADRYLEIDEDLIPTGVIGDVGGSPLDFRQKKPIGRDIEKCDGYDHCYVLSAGAGEAAATVESPETGRRMTLFTTLPAVQFYAANMLEGTRARGGMECPRYGALCLETGGYNNAVNIPVFPSTVLEPGQEYRTSTRYHFDTI